MIWNLLIHNPHVLQMSFVIINTNLENECSILLASALCQMFVKHCVENVIVIVGLRLSFPEAHPQLYSSIPLYSVALFTNNPLITKVTSRPLQSSTSLGDSFLARFTLLIFCFLSIHFPSFRCE
jgi:hypothetical protein